MEHLVGTRPPPESLLPPEAAALEWRCSRVALGDREARKLRAAAMYASQVGALGGGAWLAALRRFHSPWGGAEPIWRTSAP